MAECMACGKWVAISGDHCGACSDAENIAGLRKRIAELEAQEMGFIQSLCGQSEDIGRLKQRIEALEAAAQAAVDYYALNSQHPSEAHDKLAALLPGRGE